MTTNTVMAITGDVGAGKSTVTELFESLGGFRIDADRIVAELWRTAELTACAVERWGERILKAPGQVDHRAVAGIIFTDRAEYDWTMKMIHPRVREEIERCLGLLSEGQWAVAEIPLFFESKADESGAAPWVTASVFVTARRETRLERCRARGWDEAELAGRESYFLPAAERMARSDYVVHNDGGLDALKKSVKEIYDEVVCDGVHDPERKNRR